jgi:hypothetical protein
LQAYLASSAGLAATGGGRGNEARFLLIRAGSLTAHHAERRASQCLRAALELARQAHDADLINQILTAIDRHPHARRALAGGRNGEGISPAQLAEVLKHERLAVDFPTTGIAADKHLVLPDPPRRGSGSPFEMFDDDGFDGFDDDDDDWDDEDDDDDSFEPGFGASPGFDLDAAAKNISPEALRELQEVIRKLGHFPSPVEMMRLNPKLLTELLMAMDGAPKGTGPGKGSGNKKRGR